MFSKGEIDALVERALREGRIAATKTADFRKALGEGHLPFFTEEEIRQAAAEEKIPGDAVADLIEVVNRPDIAMFDPEVNKAIRNGSVWIGYPGLDIRTVRFNRH